MPPTKKKRLIVANPHGVAKGVFILSYKDGTGFYEGDVFIPNRATTSSHIQSLILRGYLVET